MFYCYQRTNLSGDSSPSRGFRSSFKSRDRTFDDDCVLPSISKGRARWMRRPVARFMCFSNYKLIGMKYIACKDGEWEEPLPVCVRAGCDIPDVPHSISMRMHAGAWMEYFCIPGYKQVGSPAIYCDGYQWNGTVPSCVDEHTQRASLLPTDGSAPGVLNCSFDTDMCGWQQDVDNDFEWTRINRKTPSSMYLTGPAHDHTTGSGYYLYIESTGQNENNTARLISPVYDVKLTHDGCFSFFYHMYGRYIGGLRVYQKPLSVAMEDLKDGDQHLLFEKWYNQGNYWYENVAKLRNFNEDFQIIIEGIRGQSYTSDIAIDDVAILRGENCTRAVPTTTPQPLESCEGRCNQVPESNSTDCSCDWDCFLEDTCCPDILTVCIIFVKTTTSFPPETERIVDSALSTYRTKTATPTTTVRPSTRWSTIQSTKWPTPNSTKWPTTTSTTWPTTTSTRWPLRTTKQPSTTKITSTSTSNTTTTQKSTTKTIFKSTTAVNNTTVVPRKYNVTSAATTEKPPPFRPTTFGPNSAKTTNKNYKPRPLVTEVKSQSRGKGAAITLAVLLCVVGVACAVIGARTARGRAALAKLRGRTTASSEVRYLTADTDD